MARMTGELEFETGLPIGDMARHLSRDDAIAQARAALEAAHGPGEFLCNVGDDLAGARWTFVPAAG